MNILQRKSNLLENAIALTLVLSAVPATLKNTFEVLQNAFSTLIRMQYAHLIPNAMATVLCISSIWIISMLNCYVNWPHPTCIVLIETIQ